MAAVRLGLAAIFLLAAIGKLLDRPGTRSALLDFDVPVRLAGPGAILLPAVELAAAAALIFQPTAEAGAIAAIVLLGAFTTAIARVVRLGRAPSCHCFGQLHSAPAGKTTLVRNAIFIVLSLVAVVGAPGEPLNGLFAHGRVGVAAPLGGFALGLLAAWLWSRTLARRQWQRAPAAPAELAVDTPAPPFALPDGHGRIVTLSGLLAEGDPVMLLFTSASCTQCRAYLPEVARWQMRLDGVLRIVPVAFGDRQTSHAHAMEHGIGGMIFTDEDRALIDAYAVPVTPCAILISADGLIASAPVEGAHAIDALLKLLSHERTATAPARAVLMNRA